MGRESRRRRSVRVRVCEAKSRFWTDPEMHLCAVDPNATIFQTHCGYTVRTICRYIPLSSWGNADRHWCYTCSEQLDKLIQDGAVAFDENGMEFVEDETINDLVATVDPDIKPITIPEPIPTIDESKHQYGLWQLWFMEEPSGRARNAGTCYGYEFEAACESSRRARSLRLSHNITVKSLLPFLIQKD